MQSMFRECVLLDTIFCCSFLRTARRSTQQTVHHTQRWVHQFTISLLWGGGGVVFNTLVRSEYNVNASDNNNFFHSSFNIVTLFFYLFPLPSSDCQIYIRLLTTSLQAFSHSFRFSPFHSLYSLLVLSFVIKVIILAHEFSIFVITGQYQCLEIFALWYLICYYCLKIAQSILCPCSLT